MTSEKAPGPATRAADHTIAPGESIDFLAAVTGHQWKVIWEDPKNAALKERRPGRNVLKPGDVVHIPALRPVARSAATDLVHRFTRLGVPVPFRVRLLDATGEPISDAPYRMRVGRRRYEGRTDADGRIERGVSPTATSVEVEVDVENPDDQDAGAVVWRFDLNRLEPPETPLGAQARLKNLGYYDGGLDGVIGPATERALRAFKAERGLQEDATLDDAAQQALLDAHGS